MTYLEKWDYIYQALGIRDFIYFISSPVIQEQLFGIKLIFIFFTLFFFAGVIYFYINSSYLQQKFIQDTSEFLSWQPYALRQINKRWAKIMQKAESGNDADLKLAIIEADDVLHDVLEEVGVDGETMEEVLGAAKSRIENYADVMYVHGVRNSIVYDPNFNLDANEARRVLAIYESTIKTVATA